MSDLMPWMAPWSGRILALLLAMAGAMVLWRALFFDRSRGKPRCPKCWYDATGLPTGTCPECGHTVRGEHDRFRTRRHWRLAGAALILACALPTLVVTRRVHQFGWEYYLVYGPGYWLFPNVLEESRDVAGFQVCIERDRREIYGQKTIRIRRQGIDRFRKIGDRWYIGGYASNDDGDRSISIGQDITGNGIADLILQHTPEGAHPPSTFYILELQPSGARLLGTIDGVSSIDSVQDLDGDGKYEIAAYDSTFAYWNASYAYSPMPRVIYALSADGQYAITPDIVRRFAGRTEALDVQAMELRRRLMEVEVMEDGSPRLRDCSDLWGTMLDLIYSGRSELAYDFLDICWPPQRRGKEEFIRSFQQQLGRSPYKNVIEALGHPSLSETHSCQQTD